MIKRGKHSILHGQLKVATFNGYYFLASGNHYGKQIAVLEAYVDELILLYGNERVLLLQSVIIY